MADPVNIQVNYLQSTSIIRCAYFSIKSYNLSRSLLVLLIILNLLIDTNITIEIEKNNVNKIKYTT